MSPSREVCGAHVGVLDHGLREVVHKEGRVFISPLGDLSEPLIIDLLFFFFSIPASKQVIIWSQWTCPGSSVWQDETFGFSPGDCSRCLSTLIRVLVVELICVVFSHLLNTFSFIIGQGRQENDVNV